MSCTHVRQATGDWCVQACLESFLADNGIERAQNQMVELGKQNHVCDEKGIIPYDAGKQPDYRNMIDFCALLGVALERVVDRQLPRRLENGEGFLITPTNYEGTGSRHCVRFCEHIDEDKFRVMDPAPLPDKFPEWKQRVIAEWHCEVFRIRVRSAEIQQDLKK